MQIDERADEGRRRDLRRAVENRDQQRLAHRVIAMDVLDFDGRVVDQHPDREREAAQRHDVDRLAGQLEPDDRGQDRQRNRGDDDQHAARRAEEQQHHQRDQRRGDDRFVHHVPQRAAHEGATGRSRATSSAPWARSPGSAGMLRLDRVDHRQRRGVGVLDDHQVGAALAVDAHHVGLRLMGVGDRRDVAQENRRAVDHLDRQLVEIRDLSGRSC